jgi:hypothetical protein
LIELTSFKEDLYKYFGQFLQGMSEFIQKYLLLPVLSNPISSSEPAHISKEECTVEREETLMYAVSRSQMQVFGIVSAKYPQLFI